MHDLLDKIYILLFFFLAFTTVRICLTVNVDEHALMGLKKIYPKSSDFHLCSFLHYLFTSKTALMIELAMVIK